MAKQDSTRTFTYPEVGATIGQLPQGYNYLRAQRIVGRGQALFEECGENILHWGIQKGAGFRLENIARLATGDQNRLGLYWGPFHTWAVCQVVCVIDEAKRKGFAYGTLPGHPERGEESFIVSIDDEGLVRFEILAFSKPARWFSKLGSPLLRFLQQHVTWKYLDAVHQPKVERNLLLAATKRTYASPDKSSWARTGGSKSYKDFK
jgi:uncharacterized protein (UPF0548 family)